jgi:hypothetical protein
MNQIQSKFKGAEWIQENLDAAHRLSKGRKGQPKIMSELGKRVANLLGDWQRGIYHISQRDLFKADWTSEHHIEFSMHCAGLSSYDFNDLTLLIFLAHQYALRVQISPVRKNYMQLMFHPREHNSPDKYRFHPTLEQAVEMFNYNYPQATYIPET